MYMAIAGGIPMSQDEDKYNHEQDMVMPGFRFHPTEEELIEFYLRRKVEGKRFNVELITFLDLYRYDPWELPALAAIGEKEWYFYVPRDRKYRNGDRPNRVTTSGYWKATGADRMIRTDNFRSIGLKKTLVFYSGKAPKGIRTSWIMNEYRLPQHDTDRYQKAEISLCRVYKRAGVEDHSSIPRSHSSSSKGTQSGEQQRNKAAAAGPNCATSSSSTNTTFQSLERQSPVLHPAGTAAAEHETEGSSSTITTTLGLPNHGQTAAAAYSATGINIPNINTASTIEKDGTVLLHHSKQATHDHQGNSISLIPSSCTNFFTCSSSMTLSTVDELRRIVDYQQQYYAQHEQQQQQHHQQQNQNQNQSLTQFLPLMPAPHQAALPNTLPNISLPSASFSDKLWEWNPIPEAPHRDFNNSPFK